MRVLVLDDDEGRIACFKQWLAEDGFDEIICCTHFNDAVSHLNEKFDLIHMDHDLGDFQSNADSFVDGWGKTVDFNGKHFVKKVLELDKVLWPDRVIVHSINPSGARWMVHDLRTAGIPVEWKPFSEPFMSEKDWEK